MRLYILLTSLSLCFFLPRDLSADKPIDVGLLVPVSGDFARYGRDVLAGLESVKIDQVNYVIEDEGCNPLKAITAYKKLTVANQIKLFIGPWCGSPQTAIAPLIAKENQIAILGSSAPESVFGESGGRMFSTQSTIEEESKFNAQKTYELGARKVVIVFFENNFSRAHEKSYRKHFKGEILDTLTYQTPDASALKVLALEIKKLNPDTLYIPDAFPLMHGLLKELQRLGIKDKKLFSVYSAQSDDVLEVVGKAGEGLFYSYPQIGEATALEYFPKKAGEIANAIVAECGGQDSKCALEFLNKNYQFNEYGVLRSELGLKTIKDGKFVWY